MKFDSLVYFCNFYAIMNKKYQIAVTHNIVLFRVESLLQFASLCCW